MYVLCSCVSGRKEPVGETRCARAAPPFGEMALRSQLLRKGKVFFINAFFISKLVL